MKKYFVSLLLAVFFTIIAVETKAQKLKTLVESGDAAFSKSNFYGATIFYKQAILKDSITPKLQYKYAQASRLNFDYDIAEHWYTKVYNEDKQGVLFPECIFWLATVKKSKANYKEAKELFAQYAERYKEANESYLLKKAKQEVEACDYAQWLASNPDKNIFIIHLDSSVNSKVSEFAPYMVDTTLYFSSLRNADNRDKKNNINYNKIYASIQQGDTKWSKAKELDSLFNPDNIHNVNTSFNADRSKMFINHCQQKNAQDFVCDIYVSELKNQKWSPLKKLPAEINVDGYSSTQPSTGFLGKEEVLFFSSDRPGGEGEIDIWYSKINSDGTYEKPVNAGKKVNSVEDDITPFYNNHSQELFFSSTWHKGLGSFDVFKSEYRNGAFEEPKNMGVPINSTYSDIYFSMNATNTEAFLSSNRTGSFYEERESCCNDIYMYNVSFDSTAIKAKQKAVSDSILAANATAAAATAVALVEKEKKANAYDAITTPAKIQQLLAINLYFHNDEPERNSTSTTTTQNYKTNYENFASKRDLYKRVAAKNKKIKDTILAKQEIDLLFDSAETSMRNLETFAKLILVSLKNGEQITISMNSYCSPLASSKYNKNLSKRRMKSITNYFMEYENGALVPFINNKKESEGSLTFVEKYIGEAKSSKKVSHNIHDMKNSVFAPMAAYDRKIQIKAVSSSIAKKINSEK
jgi:outer membrane protein OmpA-like peptidoglycan-associated protein